MCCSLYQPLLALAALPVILSVDAAKSAFVNAVTVSIEELEQTRSKLESQRTRVETHDASNALSIQYLNASAYTRSQWKELAHQIEVSFSIRRSLPLVKETL
jgi:hypothetical protein